MRIVTALLVLLSLECGIHAQDKFGFEFDYAQFGFDSLSNYVEFYYAFPKKGLTTVKNSAGNYVAALLGIKIEDVRKNNTILNKIWKVKQNVAKDTTAGNQALVGVLGFRIAEGKYLATVYGKDAADTSRNKVYKENFEVKPFIGKSPQISHIELSKKIVNENVDTTSIFYKNSYEVIPNPSIVFDSKMPVLFYYAELYNLKDASKKGALKFGETLVNSKGAIVYSRERKVNNVGNAIVKVGMINLRNLPTDSYNLLLTLQDTVSSKGAISGKKFFLYNPKAKSETPGNSAPYVSSEYGVLSSEDCDLLFDESRYIATADEIDRYEKLTSLPAKREFLYNFWKKRDPNPATKENEFKQEYLKRLAYVNSHFGALNKPGYKTDRGRVYLKYGKYDQIERFPSSPNRKPYEIWYYNSIEGGVLFVFGDLTGYSDYELLHSTKRGEFHDYDWQRRVIQN